LQYKNSAGQIKLVQETMMPSSTTHSSLFKKMYRALSRLFRASKTESEYFGQPSISSADVYLTAIQKLCSELSDLLPSESAQALHTKLETILNKETSIETSQAITQALTVIAGFPVVRQRLDAILNETGELQAIRNYSSVAGNSQFVQPGTLMVCPIDPTHYQKYLRVAGQHWRCPVHKCDLVASNNK
jgi:hypothetical protein